MALGSALILVVISALIVGTMYMTVRYGQSVDALAAEVGWPKALIAGAGNVVLFACTLWVAAIAAIAGVQFTGQVGEAIGAPDTLVTVFSLVAVVVAATTTLLLVAYLYDRLFPEITRNVGPSATGDADS